MKLFKLIYNFIFSLLHKLLKGFFQLFRFTPPNVSTESERPGSGSILYAFSNISVEKLQQKNIKIVKFLIRLLYQKKDIESLNTLLFKKNSSFATLNKYSVDNVIPLQISRNFQRSFENRTVFSNTSKSFENLSNKRELNLFFYIIIVCLVVI